MIRLLRALFHRPTPWRESRLISLDRTLVYHVRDREGEEQQIRHNWENKWTPVSKARFSSIECYETYHRAKFETAQPYDPHMTATKA